jgi:hypothetical protein
MDAYFRKIDTWHWRISPVHDGFIYHCGGSAGTCGPFCQLNFQKVQPIREVLDKMYIYDAGFGFISAALAF